MVRNDVLARFHFLMGPAGFEHCVDDLAAVMGREGGIVPGAFSEVISGYDVKTAV